MPYTSITHTAYGRAALAYARGHDGYGHNGNEVRNNLIVGVGMMPDDSMSFEDQMAADWRHASSKNKNQVRRIIGSFSRDELSPNDDMSIVTAAEIGVEFVEQNYPGHKAAIFVQTDGVGGLVHLHMIVSNVNTITGRGCTDEQCRSRFVATQFDTVAARHIILSTGIGLRGPENDLIFEENGVEIPDAKSTNPYVRKLRADGKYVWRDDLTQRIDDVVEHGSFTSRDEYIAELGKVGVGAEYHETKKGRRYFTYELVDVSCFMATHTAIPKNGTKAKSYKLSFFADVEYVESQMADNLTKAEQQRDMEEHPENDVDGIRKDVYERMVAEREARAFPEETAELELIYRGKKTVDEEEEQQPEEDAPREKPALEVMPEPIAMIPGDDEEIEEETEVEAELEAEVSATDDQKPVDEDEEPAEEKATKRWFSDDEIELRRMRAQAKEELRIKLAARGYNVRGSEPVTGEHQNNGNQAWIEKLEAGSQRDLVEEYDRLMADLHESEAGDDEEDMDF